MADTPLYRKVSRLINKCEKQGYQFSDLELAMFAALGRAEWDEEKVNWLTLQQFERLYAKVCTK